MRIPSFEQPLLSLGNALAGWRLNCISFSEKVTGGSAFAKRIIFHPSVAGMFRKAKEELRAELGRRNKGEIGRAHV